MLRLGTQFISVNNIIKCKILNNYRVRVYLMESICGFQKHITTAPFNNFNDAMEWIMKIK